MLGLNARSTASAQPTLPTEGSSSAAEVSMSLGGRLLNVKTILSFALGVAILVAFLRTLDLKQAWEHLIRVAPPLYALAILSYVCTFPVRGWRWRRLLGNIGYRESLPLLTQVILLSWFVNSVLPAKLGDVYRGWLMKKSRGLSMSHAVGTVLAERIIDVTALVALLAASGVVALHGQAGPELSRMLELGLLGLLIIGAGLFAMSRLGARLSNLFGGRGREVYSRFEEGTFGSFRGMPALAVLTVLAWAAEAFRLYFVTQALGLGIGLPAAVFVTTAGSLLLVVPTPGGLGAVEAGLAGVLMLLGVGREAAFSAAILDRLISYWGLILVGAPVYLTSRLTK